MAKWVNPVTTTNDADIKLVRTDNTDVIANACKKISELENKIVDIKANCDLAIEGRDIKIMELEKENAELKTQNEWLEDCKSELAEFLGKANDRIAGLEQQIEKMKRCEICKHFRWNCCSYEIRISKDCLENGMKHFELKEIEK